MTAGIELLLVFGVALACAPPQLTTTDFAVHNPPPAPLGTDVVYQTTRVNLSLRDARGSDELLPQTPVHCVILEGRGLAHGLADWLGSQPDVRELSLICLCLSDADAAAVARLPQLERLDLRGCVVSDRQLALLTASESLRELELRGASVSRGSLARLRVQSPRLVIRVDR